MLKTIFWLQKPFWKHICGKTYYIRKVLGGRVSGRAPKKKKWVLVSFPHSATPLGFSGFCSILIWLVWEVSWKLDMGSQVLMFSVFFLVLCSFLVEKPLETKMLNYWCSNKSPPHNKKTYLRLSYHLKTYHPLKASFLLTPSLVEQLQQLSYPCILSTLWLNTP